MATRMAPTGIVGSSDVPNLPKALTMSSMESVASAFRIMQFDRSLGVHVWELGLKDIGKFLYSWAPEPYRNKPMPKGMVQALLLIAPNSQTWNQIGRASCRERV